MSIQDKTFLQAIAAYIPQSLVAQLITTQGNIVPGRGQYLDAVMLFADVSGFTPISEQLARLGKEGAEELTRVLNDYFSTMITLVHSYGGAIIKFGGDAMTCMFKPESQGLLRAGTCALAMQREMAEQFGVVQTRVGKFTLQMKIGVSAGPVLAVSVGREDKGLEYVLAGSPVDRMAEAEHHATAGQVVLDRECAYMPDMMTLAAGEYEDFCLLTAMTSTMPSGDDFNLNWTGLDDVRVQQLSAQIRPYLPPTIYARLFEGQRDFVGEHRQVVSMFVLFEGLNYDDDSQSAQKLQLYFTTMQAAIDSYGGRLNRVITGDKGSLLHVIFGAPVAHEDNEIRAVECALELQSTALHSPDLDFITEQRVGIASGYVFAGNVGSENRREYTVMGDVVNLSARLMQAASPRSIWMDQATSRRVEHDFVCEALPPVRVKGKSQPIDIWQVVGRRETNKVWSAGRNVTLVGRDTELSQIHEIIQLARVGQGQALVINGEAGVGKSCLLNALVQDAAQYGAYILGGDCLSYGTRTPYLPWIGLFNTLFGLGVAEEESFDARVGRIERAMVHADPALKDWVPLMAQMLGLPMPDNALTGAVLYEVRKQRTFEIALTLLQHQAQLVPLLVLVIEDVHWSDEVSLELLNYVARNLGASPILLVALHRPTLELTEWARYPYAHFITLQDLSAQSALALARHKLNMEVLPESLPDLILRGEAHVNPYFVEEVLNTLIDEKYLIAIPGEQGEDEYVLTGDLSMVELPDSIQALVMSRIDRLDESSKLTVKVSSVVGRTFEYETVRAIYPVAISPDRLLGNFQKLDRLDLTPLERPAPEWAYLFKHITTQEVAYESLLYAHRRELHHHLAAYIEKRHPDNLVEFYELLAYHYSRSENPEKSWDYLVKAGDKARAKFANDAAIAYYKQALALNIQSAMRHRVYEALGDVYRLVGQFELAREAYHQALDASSLSVLQSAEIRRKIARAWEQQGQYDEARQYLDIAHHLLEGCSVEPVMVRIFNDLAWLQMQRGNYESALNFCELGTQQGEALPAQDESYRALAELQHTLGTLYMRMGEYELAIEHFQACIGVRESLGDLYGMVRSYNNLAAVYWNLGNYDLAAEYLSQSSDISERIGHTYGTAMCLNNLGVIYYTLGSYQQAIDYYSTSLEIRRQIGDLQGVADIYNNLGEVYYSLGELSQSASYLEQAVELFSEIGDKTTRIDAYKLLASVSLDSANCALALQYAQQAWELAKDIKNREYEGSILRVLAQISYADGKLEQALAYVKQSIALFPEGGNRLELARSHAELGRILLAMHQIRGRDYLKQALAVFSELGLDKELEKVQGWLAASL